MQTLYLTRRNLVTLLSKLDRAAIGQNSARSLLKQDTAHPKYPATDKILVIAIEDEEYYQDRKPGPVDPRDEP